MHGLEWRKEDALDPEKATFRLSDNMGRTHATIRYASPQEQRRYAGWRITAWRNRPTYRHTIDGVSTLADAKALTARILEL